MKRGIVQSIATLVANSYLPGFWKGTIYSGKIKYLCFPGLNCYSCPGALGSCPLGSLQAVIGSLKYSVSFYVLGLLSFFGTTLGRLICGWLCPFGFLQDLLHKIKTKKVNLPRSIDRPLRTLKYFLLLFFVLFFPMFLNNQYGTAPPYFCQWICPAGTLEGGIPLVLYHASLRDMVGFLFGWKLFLLLVILTGALFIYRFFCKYLCPLGAFYGFFNRISFVRLHVDPHQCTGCNQCAKSCPMQVPLPSQPNHHECIRCGACQKSCPGQAISLQWNWNCRNKTKELPRETVSKEA